MDKQLTKVEADRELLRSAQEQGGVSVLGAYVRLSGPGWLQSAITLGGGSLAGALFLGIMGGTSMLWLQLAAIIMGVVMLSAISYVTLSTGERPFQAINSHVNVTLGWGWLIATCMANMIWCMPQFSLCYAALQKNLVGPGVGDSMQAKLLVSAAILGATGFVVLMSSRQGLAAKFFDLFLKGLVGMVVICFFGVVVYLGKDGKLNWGQIFTGFIPNFSQWTQPTGEIAQLLSTLPESVQDFWSERIVKEQRAVMIGAAATAVGINMTFLMPYAMLNRGWDKTFRGLSRFDLSTGMAIPYILVTSCVVIAAASSFHAQVDENLLSSNPDEVMQSSAFGAAQAHLQARAELDESAKESIAKFAELPDDEKAEKTKMVTAEFTASLPESEKRVASSLAKRDAFQLSQSLAPLLGEDRANLVFGLGVFGMGFSTIIILMLINGYAFCEMLGLPQGGTAHVVGCLIAGCTGAIWPLVWDGPAKLWLAILASSFGMMLLPIAYFTFFMMMNSRTLMGKNKPEGASMVIWNVLMAVSVLGALAAATTAVIDKASHPTAGPVVIGVGVVYVLLVVLGFAFKWRTAPTA